MPNILATLAFETLFLSISAKILHFTSIEIWLRLFLRAILKTCKLYEVSDSNGQVWFEPAAYF